MKNKYKIARKFFDVRDFSAAEIVELTGVDESTARRYRRTRTAPPPVLRLLACAAAGFLVPDDRANRMHFVGDSLQIDTGEVLDIGQLLAWHFNRQALIDEVESLRGRLARLQRLEVIRGKANGLRLLEQPPAKAGQEVARYAPDKRRF